MKESWQEPDRQRRRRLRARQATGCAWRAPAHRQFGARFARHHIPLHDLTPAPRRFQRRRGSADGFAPDHVPQAINQVPHPILEAALWRRLRLLSPTGRFRTRF